MSSRAGNRIKDESTDANRTDDPDHSQYLAGRKGQESLANSLAEWPSLA